MDKNTEIIFERDGKELIHLELTQEQAREHSPAILALLQVMVVIEKGLAKLG